ncbi:CCA tRNA nucleotidyltransferase [Allocoleopsis franciscana]|uniref:tRNA nucleotidyltransferase/poly(A) polymerase n=1 Tax=Allocoleopsis franciscana PCC 7113 TaxID=1173027 RepID=K9WM30_9CYAN|nr:CCA tRNA nucleotidyltransferase [Allocoleopsis franciscana]AFZ21470.1 tRNA nucleotidyltransferase/poly(A) polymerase [Allocoleopsis franciscana PCC 7113]
MASSVLSPETWPFSQEWLPSEACLVGGAVRDALLGRQGEYLDLDFVLPTDAVQTARQLAQHYNAGFVVLDPDRQIARVVFEQATVDLAQQEGDSLETDLRRRDFTINAIAYNPHTQQLIDPLQGYADLQQGMIRMVSPQNLQNDPLRLLRAYRQAAQLGFKIEPATQSIIRQLAPLLQKIAAERVQVELGYLLKSPQGTAWIKTAWEDKLLQGWFPDATAQGLAQVAAVDHAAMILEEIWPEIGVELRASVGGKSASLVSLSKLSYLLPSVPEAAEEQLLNLKYSRAEVRTGITLVKHLPQLLSHATSPMSIKEQYFFFQKVGAVFPALAVLGVASGIYVDQVTPLINRYFTPDDPVAHPTQLVTGKNLMRSLDLPAGRQIGQLLTAIGVARAEGRISTAAQALEFAAQMIDTP